MPDDAALAQWLELGCHSLSIARGKCQRPSSEHPDAVYLGHDYVPPDPNDGNTMLAVLEALRERGIHVDLIAEKDGWRSAIDTIDGVPPTPWHYYQAKASTLPAAVWEVAGVVMEAEDA